MKKRISFLLAAVLILAVLLPALPVLADGENTFKADDANPTISTAADYIAFFNEAFKNGNAFGGKTITLLNDITFNDMSSDNWYAQAGVTALVGTDGANYFSGTFDGNGHTLRGVVVNGSTPRWDIPCGLFPAASGATIKNLTIDGFYVCGTNTSAGSLSYGKAGVGGLIGHVNKDITIDNVTMRNGIVTCVENGQAGIGALIGAFGGKEFGRTMDLKMTNCTVEETVRVIAGANSTVHIGGMFGYTEDNTWINSDRDHIRFLIDVTGSCIRPTGANGTLQPWGYCHNTDNNYQFVWAVKNDAVGYASGNLWPGANTVYTNQLNERMLASGCYGATAAPVVRLAGTQTRAADNAVRFVGMLKIPESLEDVSLLGFEVTVGNVTKGAGDIKCTKVYTSVLENGVQKNAPDGYYYFTFALTGVNTGTAFTVRACATVGEKVCTTTAATYTYAPAE